MSDARSDPQYKLRLTAELKDKLVAAAEENKRSLNAEINARLESSFDKKLSARETRYVFHLLDSNRINTKLTAMWADMTMSVVNDHRETLPPTLITALEAISERIHDDAKKAEERFNDLVSSALDQIENPPPPTYPGSP